jgi:hypothetical protein
MKKAAIAILWALAILVVAAPARASLGAGTEDATAVTDRSAILNGEVEPSGLLPSYYFEYGTTSAYGAKTAAIPFVLQMKVQMPIVGLTQGTVYHFRVVVKGGTQTARGDDVTFKTRATLVGPEPGGGVIPTPPGADPVVSPPDGVKPGDPPAGTGTGTTPTPPPDGAPGDPGTGRPADTGAAVQPVVGETIGAAPGTGSILVRPPAGDSFVPLEDGASIPEGSTIDSRRGSVNVVTAVGNSGEVQSATFRGAIFQVHQGHSARGTTDIFLRGGPGSPAGGERRAFASGGPPALGARPPRQLPHPRQGRHRDRARHHLDSGRPLRGNSYLGARRRRLGPGQAPPPHRARARRAQLLRTHIPLTRESPCGPTVPASSRCSPLRSWRP